MFFKNISKYICLAVFSSLILGTPSEAFDLNVLKNDKELVDHTYSSRNLRNAKNVLKRAGEAQAVSDQAFTILGQAFNQLEAEEGGVCDINLYRLLAYKLKTASLPSDADGIRALLIVWRSQNRIDDIFLDLMIKLGQVSDDLFNAYEKNKSIAVSNRTVSNTQTTMTNKDIKDADLQSLYQDFNGVSLESPGCTIESWMRVASVLPKKQLYGFNATAFSKGYISQDALQLVEFYRNQPIAGWTLTLGRYLSIAKEAKNSALPKKPVASDGKPNEQSSRIIHRSHRTTYRRSLYNRFSALQISMISDLLKRTFDRMDATKAEIVITYKKEDDQDEAETEVYALSPMEQYRMASRMLRKDMLELSNSSTFGGQPISHEDLITAALETGLINADLIDSAMKIDDLWNPYVPQWKKVMNYAFQVTGTATIFLPPPYNVISSLILVIVNGQVNQRGIKPDARNNPNVIF